MCAVPDLDPCTRLCGMLHHDSTCVLQHELGVPHRSVLVPFRQVRARQLFVSDSHNHAVRVVHIDSRVVRTLAGTGVEGSADGVGESASFLQPQAVTVDEEQRLLYIVDKSPRVRRAVLVDEPSVPSVSISAYSPEVITVADGSNGALQVRQMSPAHGKLDHHTVVRSCRHAVALRQVSYSRRGAGLAGGSWRRVCIRLGFGLRL